MIFAVVPLEKLKAIDPGWEHRRRSNDGLKALIHKNLLDALRPAEKAEAKKAKAAPMMMAAMMAEPAEPQPEEEEKYPYPLVDGDDVDNLPDFAPKEEPLQ